MTFLSFIFLSTSSLLSMTGWSAAAAGPVSEPTTVVLNVNLAVVICQQSQGSVTCQAGPPVVNNVNFVLDECSAGRCNGKWSSSVTVLGQSFSGYVVVSRLDDAYSVVAGTGPVPSLEAQLGPGGSLFNAMQIQGAEVSVGNADGSTTYLTPYVDIAPAGVPTGIH